MGAGGSGTQLSIRFEDLPPVFSGLEGDHLSVTLIRGLPSEWKVADYR